MGCHTGSLHSSLVFACVYVLLHGLSNRATCIYQRSECGKLVMLQNVSLQFNTCQKNKVYNHTLLPLQPLLIDCVIQRLFKID